MSEEVEVGTEVVDRGEVPPRFAEQITRDPASEKKEPKKRVKDPKKVAAGKKLAEYNKKAKEALAREQMRAEEQMKREEETQKENSNEEETGESKAWLPELSFTTVLSIVGIGFTAFDMFMRYYKNRIPDLSQVPKLPQPSNIHPQPSDRPKIGMV